MICDTVVFVTGIGERSFTTLDGDPYRDVHVLDTIELNGEQLLVVNKSEISGTSQNVYCVMITARRQ